MKIRSARLATLGIQMSRDPEPPMASILKLETLPPAGGDTLFANMYAAYDALSEPMKQFLGGLTATHDGGPNYRDRAARVGKDVSHKVYPANSHPVIRTHPETGRKSIYVNVIFTTHIDGVPADESRAILDFLIKHIEKPIFQCRFRWEPNSIAMWDNRCALHHAMGLLPARSVQGWSPSSAINRSNPAALCIPQQLRHTD